MMKDRKSNRLRENTPPSAGPVKARVETLRSAGGRDGHLDAVDLELFGGLFNL